MDTPRVAKAPLDSLTYLIDFGQWSADLLESDPLASVAYSSCSPAGLTVGTPALVDGTTARVRISGGAAGVSYLVKGSGTTAGGEVIEWKVWVDLDPE